MKYRKGEQVRLKGSEVIGTVMFRGATSLFIDFDGFQTLLNINRVERVKKK